MSMNRYTAQILNDKGEYHLQFKTDSKDNFKAVEKVVRKCMDRKPPTNFSKITESVESLAEFIDSLNLIDCNACVGKSICDCHIRDCKEVFIKWLQQETDNVQIS